MDAPTALREIQRIHAGHRVRQNEFQVPSAVQAGHMLVVRRLGGFTHPVTQDDLRALMYAPVPPGCSAVMKLRSSTPSKQFAVYMSLDAVNPIAPALAPPRHTERRRSVG